MHLPQLRTMPQVKGKTVVLRLDLNVPQTYPGGVGREDDWKIEKSIPTIKYILERGAGVVVVTHWGRPEGKVAPALCIAPVARYVSKLLKQSIEVWPLEVLKGAKPAPTLKPGRIAMLENIRFERGEERNDARLAKSLARLGDVYVNDAFAVCHRTAASVVGITTYLPSFAGLQLYLEVSVLEQVMKKPRAPFVLVMGGLKFETKIPVMKNLLPRVHTVCVGGGLASTVLAAQGYGVGASMIDHAYLKSARALAKNKKIFLPTDVIIGHTKNAHDFHHVKVGKTPFQMCSSAYAIYDIGPETVRRFAEKIRRAETIVWNGPMGMFERAPYDMGTLAIARLVAARSKGEAFGVAGGGETIVALKRTHTLPWVDHVSTGGGAMLEFLSGVALPGIVALEDVV